MSCIVEINGREAIPVRAIPYVEGWRQLSPDVVARGFSRTSEISELLCDLTAHHVSDGGIGDMLPKEWDNIVDALNALEIELNEKDSDHRKTRPEWLRRSIECLPAGCFVWRDELEASYNSQFGWRQSIHGGVISPIHFVRLDNAPERPGEHELNFNPRIPPEMTKTVFEGMPLPDQKPEKPTPESSHAASHGNISEKLAFLNQASTKFWANAKCSDKETQPDNATVEKWLKEHGFSQTLAEKGATIIRPEWAVTGRKPEK